MKVPNKILKTSLALAQLHNGNSVAPPASEDVKALIEWAQAGITKRAQPAAPKDE